MAHASLKVLAPPQHRACALSGLAKVYVLLQSPSTSPPSWTPAPLPLSPPSLRCYTDNVCHFYSTHPLFYLCFYFRLSSVLRLLSCFSASFYRKDSSEELSLSLISVFLLFLEPYQSSLQNFITSQNSSCLGTSEPCLAWSWRPSLLLTSFTYQQYFPKCVLILLRPHCDLSGLCDLSSCLLSCPSVQTHLPHCLSTAYQPPGFSNNHFQGLCKCCSFGMTCSSGC